MGQCRVFSMMQQEVLATPYTITGTLKIFGSNAFVLIDTEATHSFI